MRKNEIAVRKEICMNMCIMCCCMCKNIELSFLRIHRHVPGRDK